MKRATPHKYIRRFIDTVLTMLIVFEQIAKLAPEINLQVKKVKKTHIGNRRNQKTVRLSVKRNIFTVDVFNISSNSLNYVLELLRYLVDVLLHVILQRSVC